MRLWHQKRLFHMVGLLGALLMVYATLPHVAYGATLLSDTFEDGNADGWAASGGSWSVVSDGSKAYQQSTVAGTSIATTGSGWGDQVVEARVKPLAFSGGSEYAAILGRVQDASNYYILTIRNANKVEVKRVVGGSAKVLSSASLTVDTGTWYTLRLSIQGSTLTGYVNGTQYVTASDSQFASGKVGLSTYNGTASFDDVSVSGDGTGTSPTATPTGPTSTPTKTPTGATATPTKTPAATATVAPTTGWPTANGSQPVSSSIAVKSGQVYDGGMKRFYGTGALGSGGQDEGQDPIFDLAAGATLKNVILGSPAADGVHCAGSCTLENVWWEDVGEDAATFRGSSSSNTYLVNGGGARKASDKVFQHNGAGTLTIQNFQVDDFGKLYRSCGNCSTQYKRNVVLKNITATYPGTALVGINTNYGDTARFSGITIKNDSSKKLVICQKFIGNDDGDEPTTNGSGADGTYCIYSSSDITYK